MNTYTDFADWLEMIDVHYAALSTAALTNQDDVFEATAQRIDDMIDAYPQYWDAMKAKRNMPGF